MAKSEEKKEIVTLEESLTLIVKEQKLGELITNAKDIQSFVVEKLKEYTIENYKGDDKKAAEDKAVLNNAIKKLNDERIKLEKMFMKPFDEFKGIVKDTCDMIQKASDQLATVVKQQEEIRKAEKRKEIETYWNSLNCEIIKLDQIFNPKWLNKGSKIKDIKLEIDNTIKDIKENLETLGQYGEDSVMLQALYMASLDLTTTLKKAAELKANRELLAKQEEEKKNAVPEPEQGKKPVINIKNDNKIEIPIPHKQTPESNQNNKIITFYVNDELSELARQCNLSSSPIKMMGNIDDVKKFKDLLLKSGYSYTKEHGVDGLILNMKKNK